MTEHELKDKIKELESRINRLEKLENKRKTLRIIKTIIRLIILLIILFALLIGYNYVNETFIKPYKETIVEIKEKYNDVKNYDFSLDNILEKNKKRTS